MPTKICSKCLAEKPLVEFYRRRRSPDGKQPICSVCEAAKRRRDNGLKQVREAGRPRPKVCEVCERPSRDGNILHFDHDHATGGFRGWLCDNCNRALGLAGDSPVLLRRLADYLEHSGPGALTYADWLWHSAQGRAT